MAMFYDRAVKQVSALPGVRSAAVCSALPVRPVRFSPVLVEGQPEVPLAARPILAIQMVSPAYFRTLRVALRQGREFAEGDGAEARRWGYVILNTYGYGSNTTQDCMLPEQERTVPKCPD